MTEETKQELLYKPGMQVKVYQKIKELNTKGEEKERVQVYEGIIIAARHGKESGATITVRKMSEGIGVEKIFPIFSPVIDKIEIVRQMEVRRSRLNFLRKPQFKRKMKDTKAVK